MEITELKNLIAEAQTAIKTKADGAETKAIEAFQKAEGLVNELTKTKEALDANKTELDTLRKELNTLAANMNKPKAFDEGRQKSFDESFFDGFNEALPLIQKHLANKNMPLERPIEILVKSPISIGVGNTIGAVGSSGQTTISQFTGIVSTIRKRILTYLENVSVGAISTTYAVWVEALDEQGTPIATAELATKPQISVRFEERRMPLSKYPAWSKVSTEMLADASYLRSYVVEDILKRIEIAVENDLFGADGTSGKLKGITQFATAFTGGSLAGTLTPSEVTNYDVIRAVALQVFEAHGQASAIFIKAGQLAAMNLEKGSDGHYVMPFWANGNVVYGVRLIETTGLPSGIDFVGGDLSVVKIMMREGLTIKIGESGTDFIDNLQTILGEMRLSQFVSANDTQVLVKGSFAAAKAILDTTT